MALIIYIFIHIHICKSIKLVFFGIYINSIVLSISFTIILILLIIIIKMYMYIINKLKIITQFHAFPSPLPLVVVKLLYTSGMT